MQAGIIPVESHGQRWTLTSSHLGHRELGLDRPALATALGLAADDICWNATGARPLWLDNGTEQLIVPLHSPAAVRRTAPRVAQFERCVSRQGRRMAYVFAESGPRQVEARFFFEADGAFREDPATGSACANLGGWYLATGAAAPLAASVSQGVQVRRPSFLYLSIDAQRNIHVGGDVVALGQGAVEY
jgi:PhzF family phenazine biosynthesis protein